ncbi:MAG: hypothetical protein ACI4XW_11500 [Candidatus Spyradocola sp.]
MKRKSAGILLMTLALLLCVLCTACGGKGNREAAIAAVAGSWTSLTNETMGLEIHADGSWELYKDGGLYSKGELEYHKDDGSVWMSPENNTQWSVLNNQNGILTIGPLGSFRSIGEGAGDVVSEDWRESSDTVDSGFIVRDGADGVYVLVTVDENGADFYLDEPEQMLYDCVCFPMTMDNARRVYNGISFDDRDGDGQSDVAISLYSPEGEGALLVWIWDPENGYVYRDDLSVLGAGGEDPDEPAEPAELSDYAGFWEYPDGEVLEISEDGWWYLYEAGEDVPLYGGPVEVDEDACYLMNDDGSSGGGMVYFDEEGYLVDSDYVLSFIGMER